MRAGGKQCPNQNLLLSASLTTEGQATTEGQLKAISAVMPGRRCLQCEFEKGKKSLWKREGEWLASSLATFQSWSGEVSLTREC